MTRLERQREHIGLIRIVDDHSTDPRVFELIDAFQAKLGKDQCIVWKGTRNYGWARRLNEAIASAFKDGCDQVFTLDSDALPSPVDWLPKLSRFMSEHPEVGMAGPDKPGCYLRLHRDGYDEIEFLITICCGISRAAYEVVTANGEKWYDESLGTSWDADTCYRLRMQGFRIALVPDTRVEDLGGYAASTMSKKKFGRGNYYFNRKWNERFIGRFLYKCPMMLRFEDYPLNMQFRRLVNAQQRSLRVVKNGPAFCGHASDVVTQLVCTGNHPTPEQLSQYLEEDIWISQQQTLKDVDDELLEGKRCFAQIDLKPYSLKHNEKSAYKSAEENEK